MEKNGLWTNEQEARDMLICQMIWIRTGIYYLAGTLGLVALGFACLIKDFYPDTAFALIAVIAISTAIQGFRHQRKADYIEKDLDEQDYDETFI